MTATTIASDLRARRDAVRLPSRRAVAGVASLPEMMATYGVYLFFGAVALAAIAIIIINMAADAVVDEAEIVVKAVTEMYQHQRGSNKAGLSAASMSSSGRLPAKLTEHGTGEVWIADGDYPVFFAPGGTADPIPATMHLGDANAVKRYAVIQFGDDANPLPSELCSDIALAPYIGLVGLAILPAVAGDDKASTSIGAATATRPTTTSRKGHWSIRAPAAAGSPTAINLDDLASGDVDVACGDDAAHVALILR